MDKLRSLEYFKSMPSDPEFEIYNAIEKTDHPCHEMIILDLQAIPGPELNEYCDQYHVDFYIGRQKDKDLARRTWFLKHEIRTQIAMLRKELLIESQNNSHQSDPELSGVEFDDKGLVDIQNFTPYNGVGLMRGETVFNICPSTNASNSSYWLSDLIFKQSFQNNRKFKVRLDPLIKVNKEMYQPMFFKMWVYGTKLDWNRLKTLKSTEHGQWLAGPLSDLTIEFTDFTWTPSETEIHFTCEELPKDDFLFVRGSRYFHAIFDKASGAIKHCDGAIRFYTPSELEYRKKFHVKNAEVRKIGKRIKIFQIDELIDQVLFMQLATNFLVWNEDAIAYFN